MEDKFGNIKDEALGEYYKMLIGRVYKLLPMKENDEDNKSGKRPTFCCIQDKYEKELF